MNNLSHLYATRILHDPQEVIIAELKLLFYNRRMYDCIVVGGGPAGLSAAIYLARFNRSVLVIDRKTGRSTFPQVNENYLGFPAGIQARKLRLLGKRQAKQFGAEFANDTITAIRRTTEFQLMGKKALYRGKSVIIATGVSDVFPDFPRMNEFIGKSLFWCITCDGYKVRNKRVVVVGRTDSAAVTCLQMQQFTKNLTFIYNCDEKESTCSDKVLHNLQRAGIPVYAGLIQEVTGSNGMIETINLSTGITLQTDFIFNQQGSKPNSELVSDLHVTLDEHKYIIVDEEQRTNTPFLYAAGDVTKQFAHQVITAAHEGSMAAQAANYDLYAPEQRE
jgi:thioredoxin reductase (NADPH)